MTIIESPPAHVCAERDSSRERDPRSDVSLVAAIADGTELQKELYLRYRRPLLQIFHQRRIARDAAEDLLQKTFLQAIKKIRAGGLDDPSNLGGYLYRTACKLAIAYWRGVLSREYHSDRELLSNLEDEAVSLEERLNHEQLASCVRTLMGQLPLRRDREVLERFYLREEPRMTIRDSLQMSELQFNQVLWRARKRFGEILRAHGFAGSEEARPAQTTSG